MPFSSDFQAFGIGAGANVLSVAAYELETWLSTGFQSGILPSQNLNTPLRQSTFVAAGLTQWMVNALNANVQDNGNLSGFVTQIASLIPALPNANTWGGLQTFNAGIAVAGAKSTLAVPVAGYASLNLPHGAVPTTLANGDIWTTSSGLFIRINGVTWQMSNVSGANSWGGLQTFTAGLSVTGGSISGVPGRLIGVQVFSTPGTSTYTPTTGTTSVIVEAQGAGGSGGSVAGPNNGSLVAISGAGSAGSYGRARITSGFSGVTVTVGAGGTAPAAANAAGNAGGSSSFGSLLISPGGVGGLAGSANTPPIATGGGSTPTAPTGANIFGQQGSPGGFGIGLNASNGYPPVGGSSFFGTGGQTGVGAGGNAGLAAGAGGSGVLAPGSFSTGLQGGPGANGIVIVWEYA